MSDKTTAPDETAKLVKLRILYVERADDAKRRNDKAAWHYWSKAAADISVELATK